MNKLLLIIFSLAIVSFCGCPDYSHLRPVPDYKNMSDTGEETIHSDEYLEETKSDK
jgi:hypothetical protein